MELRDIEQALCQNVFDRVVRHLAAQKARAVDPASLACQYRAPGGLKCAIGVLMDDQAIEEHGVRGAAECSVPSVLGAVRQTIGWELNVDFGQHLQAVHDSYPLEDWPVQLRAAACWGGSLRTDLVDELMGEGWIKEVSTSQESEK